MLPALNTTGAPARHNLDAAGNLKTVRAAPGTGTQTSVASTTASQVALAANAARRGAIFHNDDANGCKLLLAAGTASATNYSVAIATGARYELPDGGYTGACAVIWDADGTGSLRVTEFTA